ncbi:disulfide oxidoreductase [Alkalicoccus saliphilus]|uniref:Probable disulfide formation protein n=1 Tax=Alkalicoccus saliphilus TaxID=200989 RepID=A0A2T4U787_9BACI|nr:disulfide oxidoreductase [Alkalicoccus saliphilus]PTL39269.1 disulfide bond formation protein B [Alkalicoccus saliphilus]
MKNKVENYILSAWAAAFTAVLGSLFFSEILNYVPCDLCWVQRIFMYPLAVILAVAFVKKDAGAVKYALPLSIIGGGVSLYHFLIQKVPAMSEQGTACGIVPCNAEYINWAGFITIPFLAFTAFTFISVLLLLTAQAAKRS